MEEKKKTKTIAFLGDSFCSNLYTWTGVDTYIQRLSEELDAEVVQLGVAQSSILDTILIQLPTLLKQKTLPDYLVICWTGADRLYHRKVRNIMVNTATDHEGSREVRLGDPKVWEAAEQFYRYLYDEEASEIIFASLLAYADRQILKPLQHKIKICHVWSFADWKIPYNGVRQARYPHSFESGSEIRPGLMWLATSDRGKFTSWELINKQCRFEKSPNHLNTDEKNRVAAEWISAALRTEQPKLMDYSQAIEAIELSKL